MGSDGRAMPPPDEFDDAATEMVANLVGKDSDALARIEHLVRGCGLAPSPSRSGRPTREKGWQLSSGVGYRPSPDVERRSRQPAGRSAVGFTRVWVRQ